MLAQARASLKEPSRPYTPNSLDEKTTLDSTISKNAMLSDGMRSMYASGKGDLYSTLTDNLRKPKLGANPNKSLEIPNNNNNNAERKISTSGFASGDIAGTEGNNSELQILKLMLRDIIDLANSLDQETSGVAATGVFSSNAAQTIVENLSAALDKIAKIIKSNSIRLNAGNFYFHGFLSIIYYFF